jgi:glutamate synthase domain-containing protein 3
VELEVFGTTGNDLRAFMNGPRIIVHGNAQDGCGNTMNEGEVIVYRHDEDIIGLSARGGKIFVQEDVGYRAGIHMKEYQGKDQCSLSAALPMTSLASTWLGAF